MKKMLCTVLTLMFLSLAILVGAEEPTIYVIKQGDTLWGLSERFLKDPYYWPNLWSRNQVITNPHFIYPGQKVKVYPDRIEIMPPGAATVAAPVPTPPQLPAAAPEVAPSPAVAAEAVPPKEVVKEVPKVLPPVREVAREKAFTVTGGEGFILEDRLKPYGYIIATYQSRSIVGEDDVVYTDIGKVNGAKVGDRFSIFKKMEPVSHPVTNVTVGYKVAPLGSLQLSQVEEKVSKAIITKSYLEIGPGSYLMPYRSRRQEIALKSADRDLQGYIVATQTGNEGIAEGDIAYLDLGKKQGLAVGNFLYVVRDVVPDTKYAEPGIEKLPEEVLGALVVVASGENTSTVLVVKSIETLYRGDRVELKKSR
jgi:hypothetical protein